MSTRGLTVPACAGPFLPALPPGPDTEAVSGKLASQADGARRPWSIWLPCAPTFACPGALIMAARGGCRHGQLRPGAGPQLAGRRGRRAGVLAAVDGEILTAGVKRPRPAHLRSPVRAVRGWRRVR